MHFINIDGTTRRHHVMKSSGREIEDTRVFHSTVKRTLEGVKSVELRLRGSGSELEEMIGMNVVLVQ